MLKNYNEVLDYLKNCDSDDAFFIGEISEQLIDKAEEVLSIKFSFMYRRFLKEFGSGSYGGFEVLGITDDNFEDSSVPNGIWYTLSERKFSNLPKHLVVIYEVGNGDLICQDYSNIKDSEPLMVVYTPGLSNNKQSYEVIANNFGEFMVQMINLEIE